MKTPESYMAEPLEPLTLRLQVGIGLHRLRMTLAGGVGGSIVGVQL